MAPKFPKFDEKNLLSQETEQNPCLIRVKVKLLKPTREKGFFVNRGLTLQLTADFSLETSHQKAVECLSTRNPNPAKHLQQ